MHVHASSRVQELEKIGSGGKQVIDVTVKVPLF
jgi:hypothetical protein